LLVYDVYVSAVRVSKQPLMFQDTWYMFLDIFYVLVLKG